MFLICALVFVNLLLIFMTKKYSSEKARRMRLEEIVGIGSNSSFTVASGKSEIKICDLKEVFDVMCPVQIFIDGKIVWDDNQIVDDWTAEDVREFQDLYFKTINRDDKVKKFTFYTVAFHHSVVVIETEK